MDLVLDSPVSADVSGDLGCGAGQAGDAVQDVFTDALTVRGVGVTADPEGLGGAGEVDAVGWCGPDGTDDPVAVAVLGVCRCGGVRYCGGEPLGDRGEQCGPVAFDGEDVAGLALQQVCGGVVAGGARRRR